MKKKRDLITLTDLGSSGLVEMLDRSAFFAKHRGAADHPRPLVGKTVALLFDKPSTRTRVSLEVATVELGGHPLVLEASTSQMSRGEPVADTARVLTRMVHAMTYRTGAPERLADLARYSTVPVLNALTDAAHPLQVIADLFTVKAERARVEGLRYVWIGDASNVARSWIEAAGLLKLDLALATPPSMQPPAHEVEEARALGARITLTQDVREASRGADVLMTDVWVSMGQEAEAAARRAVLEPYRITRELLSIADKQAMVLHCLPAHRGEEIEAEVVDGPQSYVFPEAEARLHTSKAALAWAVEPG
jgi:ornithine carbamoyltransferase